MLRLNIVVVGDEEGGVGCCVMVSEVMRCQMSGVIGVAKSVSL